MKIKKNNEAVNEMLGTVLLLLIAVSIFSVVHASVLSYPAPNKQPAVTVIGEIQGDGITLIHRGGESLSLQTKISFDFEIDNNKIDIIAGELDYLDSKSKENGKWDIGEILIFNPSFDFSNQRIRVIVIDVVSNSIVMNEILQ